MNNIRLVTYVGIAGVIVAIGGCAVSAQRPSGEEAKKATPTARPLDPQQAERLKTVMVPLLAKMDKPLDPSQASVSFLDSPDINAANAGGGKFFVTRGFARKSE